MIRAASMFPCDGTSENPDTRNVSILGVFTTYRVSRLPSPERPFSLYALLTGHPDEEAAIELAFERPLENEPEVLVSGRVSIGGFGSRHVVFRIESIRFGRTGLHKFVLRCGRRTVAECSLQVMLTHDFN